MIQVWPHYEVKQMKSIEDVREIFDDLDDISWDMNWLFLSTSGVHGSYISLDDLESWDETEEGYEWPRFITILIVHPRLVVIRYGEILIQPEDVPYLRECVKRTIEAITKSQEGNLPGDRK